MAAPKNFDRRTEVDIPLNFPVTVDGKRYESLTIRRPKNKNAAKVESVTAGDARKGVILYSDLCQVPQAVIEELDEIDTHLLSDQLEAFQGTVEIDRAPPTFDPRDKVTIPLEFKVTTEDGFEHESLTIRRPKGKDSIKAQSFRGSAATKGMLLLADLCGVTPDVIEELDGVDQATLDEQLRAFTGRQAG